MSFVECNPNHCPSIKSMGKSLVEQELKITELEQQKAKLINILKSIAKMKENDENELSRITKEIIDILEKYK